MNYTDTWVRRLQSLEEVPEFFREFAASAITGCAAFPYILFSPPGRMWRRKTNPKLIILLDQSLVIAEKDHHQLRTIGYDYRGIGYLESGTVLLRSWLKLAGMTPDGPLETRIE